MAQTIADHMQKAHQQQQPMQQQPMQQPSQYYGQQSVQQPMQQAQQYGQSGMQQPSQQYGSFTQREPLSAKDQLRQSQQKQQEQQMNVNYESVEISEIYEALRHGKMPSNAQLADILNRLQYIRAIEERRHLMSADGQRLLDDFHALIQTLQRMLQVKNSDQLFQSLYYHLHSLNLRPNDQQRARFQEMNTGADKGQMKQDAKGGANAFFQIGRLVLTNGKFRDQMGEFLSILQEIFGDATGKVSDTVQDTTQTISQESQKMNEKINQGSQKMNQKMQHMNENAQQKANKDPDQLMDNIEDSMNSGSASSQKYKNASQNLSSQGNDMHSQLHGKKEQWKQGMHQQGSNVRDKFHQEGANAKDYAHQKFPPEKVEDIVERLKDVLVEVQSKPRYQEAIDTILWLVKKWSDRAGGATQASSGRVSRTTREVRSDPNWSAAEKELKTILEDWAQGRSLDPLSRGIESVIEDVKNDQELRTFYDQAIHYLERLLKEPGYVASDESTEDGKRFVNRAHELTQGRYSDHINFVMDESRAYLDAMENDPMARELEMRFKQIHNDLWLDAEGNTTFKPQLLTDMRLTLLPTILEFIKFLPVPRIEYEDRQFDVVIENVVLPGDTLLPGNMEVKMDNYLQFSPYTNVTNLNQQSMFIRMSDIRTTVKDVVWFFKRKVGFPKISDRGVATLEVGGKRGVSANVKVVSDSQDPMHTFRVVQCKCYIDQIKLDVKNSKYNAVYKTVKPLMISILRRQIAKAIETKIIETIGNADAKLTQTVGKHYNEAMAKEASIHALAPNNQMQYGTTTTTMAPGQPTAVQQQGTTYANNYAYNQDSQTRPGLFVALLTIMQRSVRSNMVSSAQKQHEKRKKKKLAKEKEAKNKSSDKQSNEGVGTVPVIVGTDGKTYMQLGNKLVPVQVQGGTNDLQSNSTDQLSNENEKKSAMSKGKSFFSNKMADAGGNQDTNYQPMHSDMMTSNTARV